MKYRIIAFSICYLVCHIGSVSAIETKTVSDPATGMEFVLVKGGCFNMGSTENASEKPVHEICVNDFYLGKYEVTQAQWEKVMGSNPSSLKDCGPMCPVDNVSWNDAQVFIKKLNEKSNKTYRLPTEGEWEYAAGNGGKNEPWPGTADKAKLGEYAWFAGNSNGVYHKVGEKKPNGLGLYDMSGNVWEWCQDWYSETYYAESPKNTPSGPATGVFRAARGGSYDNDETSLRVANRDNLTPDSRNGNLGLRLLFVPN
jgi:formylglycine-generating enzyme required for sulfatase activity